MTWPHLATVADARGRRLERRRVCALLGPVARLLRLEPQQVPRTHLCRALLKPPAPARIQASYLLGPQPQLDGTLRKLLLLLLQRLLR